MLTISQQQLDAFSQSLLNDYVARTMERLRRVYPDYYYKHSTKEVEAFIREAIQDAAAFGLESETTVGRFLDYRLWFGSNFESTEARDWMVEVLSDASATEFQKIHEIDVKMFGYSLEEPDCDG